MTRLKVVFQGGGAKLVSLIAAAEILQDLERDGQIEIVRVAGVSAGAIAAAVIAGGVNSELFRTKLLHHGRAMLNAFPTNISSLRLSYLVMRGKPIYPERQLRTLLEKLFVHSDVNIDRFHKLQKPLVVTASSIRNGEKIVYDSQIDRDQHLVDALVDSCALPFAFRTFKDNQLIVDGGICSNMPVDDILAYDAAIPTLAIGFEPQPPGAVSSAATYGLALLSTAIDSATAVALTRIKLRGGEECLLPAAHGTFEFAAALRALDGEDYKTLKARVNARIDAAISNIKARSGTIMPLENHDAIIHAHRNLTEVFPYSIGRCWHMVTASCLGMTGGSYSAFDSRQQAVEFQANGDEFLAVRMGLSVNNSVAPSIKTHALRVETLDDDPIESEQIIVSQTTKKDGTGRPFFSSLIFLRDKLPAERGLRAVLDMQHRDCMIDLKRRGWDWMRGFSSAHHWPVFDQILLCPDTFDDLEFSDLLSKMHKIPEGEASDLDIAKEQWVAGRPMTTKELRQHFKTMPAGYRAYGWRVTDVLPGKYCGCFIQKVG